MFKYEVELKNYMSGILETVELVTNDDDPSTIRQAVYDAFSMIMFIEKVTLVWSDDF